MFTWLHDPATHLAQGALAHFRTAFGFGSGHSLSGITSWYSSKQVTDRFFTPRPQRTEHCQKEKEKREKLDVKK